MKHPRRMPILFLLCIGAADPAGSDKPTQSAFGLDQALAGMGAGKKVQSGELYATIHTSQGDLVAHLFEKEAPNTVANFIGLARGTREWKDAATGKWVKRPLYKNVLCHRVIPNFMIQCGDPSGTGRGGPGYTFADELNPALHHDKGGLLSMANRGPNTNGSQFFITEAPAPHLDGRHAIFGEIVKNAELIAKIARVKVGDEDRPLEDVVIKSIDIYRSEKAPK
jgi:peptidyl-prolyl cis-trans isomerase A (cyclophilin A)